MGGNQFIVQVSRSSVLLLRDSDLVQTLELELAEGEAVVAASCCDPYLGLLTATGQALVLSLNNNKLGLIKTRVGEVPGGRAKAPFQAISLYKDVSGLLTSETRTAGAREKKGRQTSNKTEDLDDEDELLYGSSDYTVGMFGVSGPGGADKSFEEEESWRRHLEEVAPTFWLAGVRDSGNLELYSVPDFTVRFLSHNFPHQADVLSDAVRGEGAGARLDSVSPVTELLLTGLGMAGRRPVLLARTRDLELVMYELYPFHGKDLAQDQLRVRFKKLNHGLILRERKKKRETPLPAIRKTSLRHFSDIAGYEGVFVSGSYPHWLFLTGRGELRCHPMSIDGSVSTFSPFHNVNCPQGFLYFNRKCELRICVLPGHLSYDAPWPVRKVNIFLFTTRIMSDSICKYIYYSGATPLHAAPHHIPHREQDLRRGDLRVRANQQNLEV